MSAGIAEHLTKKELLVGAGMKNKFKDGALYYILIPGTNKQILAKASSDGGKRANFFFCDLEGFMKWESIEHAYQVELKMPSRITIDG